MHALKTSTERTMDKTHQLLIAGLLGLATLLPAGTALAETSFATIRTDKVLREAPQAQEIRAKLQADFERRANELQSKMKQFEEDVAKYQREKDIMSAADRVAAEKKLHERRLDLGLQQETLQQEASARERQLTLEGMKAINTVIEDVAKARDVDVVLRDPVYIRDGLSIDITDEVLEKLGKK